MFKIGVLVSGGGTNLQAIIDNIENNNLPNCEISKVISSKEGVYAIERCNKHNISSTVMVKKNYGSFEEYMQALGDELENSQVNLIVLAGFMTVLSESFTKRFENKIINIHPSLIPAFCGDGFYGIKVHQGVIEKGVKVSGATVHFVNEETDGGPIILQKPVYINDEDTAETLQKRIMEEAEWVILPEAIKLISQGEIEVFGNKTRRKA